MFREDGTLPESSEQLLHHFAYSCYQQGIWDNAISIFRLLVMIAPQKAEYWYGLGSSLMVIGQDKEAAHAFELATIQNPDLPEPYLHWAECEARLGNNSKAELLIDAAEEKAQNATHSSFQDKIDVIKERVIRFEAVR